MRAFIILCLTSLAVAAPQGYNYAVQQQQHQHHGGSGTLGTSAFLKDLQAVTATAGLEAPGAGFGASFSSGGGDGGLLSAGSFGAGGNVGISSLGGYDAHAHQQPIVSKRFFLHSAPEEAEEEVQQRYLTIGQPRKNYNVVFVKAPSKAAQRTSLKITPAVNEDKTVIYVLAKKPEEAQIDAHVHEPATTTAKPEVFFIKYRTNEEAEHAQRTIQSQYDSLGGSTHISNEGYAPVSSVIGSLGGGAGAGAGSGVGFGAGSGAGYVAGSGAGFGAGSGAGFGAGSGAGVHSGVDAGVGFGSAIGGGVGGADFGAGAPGNAYLPPNKFKH